MLGDSVLCWGVQERLEPVIVKAEMNVMGEDQRCRAQKISYVPEWPPEKFTVPLLGRRIPELFHEFGLPPRGEARALDAGCGMQPFRPIIEAGGYTYTGLDVVQNRAGTVDLVSTLDGIRSKQWCEVGLFDFILCTEVLEHVAGWEGAFENIAASLAPRGRVLITCPHFYPLHEVPFDFWRPTPYAVEHFALSNALKVIHLEMAGGPWEVLGTLLAETHCYPMTNRLMDRIVAKCGRAVRGLVNCWLQSDWVRARALLRGPYFLSVYAVLEKTDTGAQT